jgi:hypothetical protein
VELEIRPEPAERDAVVAAAEALLCGDGRPAAYRSTWRSSGIRENLDDDVDQGDAGRLRSRPGAKRA